MKEEKASGYAKLKEGKATSYVMLKEGKAISYPMLKEANGLPWGRKVSAESGLKYDEKSSMKVKIKIS